MGSALDDWIMGDLLKLILHLKVHMAALLVVPGQLTSQNCLFRVISDPLPNCSLNSYCWLCLQYLFLFTFFFTDFNFSWNSREVSFFLKTSSLLLLFRLMWFPKISDRPILLPKYKIRGHDRIKIALFIWKVDYPDLWVISIVLMFEWSRIRDLDIITKI